MPGFVDVSNWSDQDVKRLGQIDDDDSTPGFRGRSRSTRARDQVTPISFAVSDVWAAACAADRVNGGYFKECVFEYTDGEPPKLVKDKNRHIMMHFLYHPEQLLVEDVERGEACRDFLRNDLTFRVLQGKALNSFDDAIRKVLAVEERFNAHQDRYELAIVACLPASVSRSQSRQTVEERVKFARGGHIGKVGEKITLTDVEVLSANYSRDYNIYWIKAITDQDQVVFFSNKESFDVGTHLSIQGKVKAHRDENLTQLNYVKVL